MITRLWRNACRFAAWVDVSARLVNAITPDQKNPMIRYAVRRIQRLARFSKIVTKMAMKMK